MKIAILITCYNRKIKTLQCLRRLYAAYQMVKFEIHISIYLTDDCSTDGTTDAVHLEFPDINIFSGNGNLYWAGGMIKSWQEALKVGFDAYLLLNDDTYVLPNVFDQLYNANEYSIKQFKSEGIYIGSTHDGKNKLTYGGSIIKSKLFNSNERIFPDGSNKICDFGNANIMMVTQNVINHIGIFSSAYTHGLADFDYTLTARKNKIPVLTTGNFCGICINDNFDKYEKFRSLTFRQRCKFLYHPKGLAFSDQVKYMSKFFPLRLPLIYLGAWFKLFFPNSYYKISKLR